MAESKEMEAVREAFFEEVRKTIAVMPKRPPIIVKEGKVVGVKLNSATIEELSKLNYVKPVDENYINYLMGVNVYRDDTVSKPIYIVEGEIETELQQIKSAEPSEALKGLKHIKKYYVPQPCSATTYNYLEIIEQALLKAQKLEKENEILKEIIKSFFDKGSPLHQYIDNKFGLTIEVDSECSIMHLGEFKGIDLDNKLKEVLENE